jgi:hypothetical protein
MEIILFKTIKTKNTYNDYFLKKEDFFEKIAIFHLPLFY